MNKAKRLWVSQNTGKSLAVTCMSVLAMQACSSSHTDDKSVTKSTDTTTSTSTTTTTSAGANSDATTKTSDTATTTSTTTGAADKNTASDGKTAAGADKTTATADGKSEGAKGAKDPASLLTDMPEVAAASQKVDLHKMPDADVICTVKGTPITVGDYKQEFKLREAKVQAMLSASAELEQNLVAEAAKRNISLTDDEKKRLVETSHKAEAATGKIIKDFLKENKLTEKQFDEKVIRLGLALKTSASITRQTLLNELVDQQLLVQAAKDKGYYSKAFHKYIETKQTPEYKQLLAETGLTPDQAQNQIIDRELIDMYIQFLKNQNANATDQQIQKVYDDNKEKLKHGERYRLSQIVIAAPQNSKDQPGIEQQLRAADPKMSEKDAKAKATQIRNEQKKKADDILAKILKGAKFADVANETTDDPANRSAKNGGDIGWKEKTALEPEFVTKIATLKVGQVYPTVLPTRFGYHILKLEGKEGPGVVPLADVKDQIKQELIQSNQIKAVVEWIEQQHKSGTIKLSPAFEKLVGPGTPAAGQKTP